MENIIPLEPHSLHSLDSNTLLMPSNNLTHKLFIPREYVRVLKSRKVSFHHYSCGVSTVLFFCYNTNIKINYYILLGFIFVFQRYNEKLIVSYKGTHITSKNIDLLINISYIFRTPKHY